MALPRLIPLDELFALPDFCDAQLSPDGTRIGYRAPAFGHLNVWIRGIDETHEDAILVTRSKTRSVPAFQFTSNPRYMLFRQDDDGNEDWRYYRVDLEDLEAEPFNLTPLEPGQRVLGASDENGKVRVVMNPRWVFFDHFDVDLLTGETTLVYEAVGMMSNYTDTEGNKGFYTTQAADGTLEIYAVDDRAAGSMRLVLSEDGPSFPIGQHPLMASPDQCTLYIASYWGGSDALRMLTIDHATGEKSVLLDGGDRSVCVVGVYEHDFGYPTSMFISRRTGEPIAFRWSGERPEVAPIDPAFAEVYAELMKLADGGELGWMTSDKEENLWTATFIHDRKPGLCYLYDHRTRTSTLLHDPSATLDPDDLAEVHPIHFTARDGLPMHGFLTLPKGVEAKNLPLVVKVHGGPWLQDLWRYSPHVQLLANRGYAVLQVNYRASTGYGQRHIKAGIREYGGKMNDDLIDGCEWAVAQGIADPTRLGIFGTSQGGYMTLVAVTTMPDYFAAAVDDVGFSNIVTLLGDHPDWIKQTQLNNFVTYCGDTSKPEDVADMESRSPSNSIDKIRTPLVVIAGGQDPRVLLTEHEAIVNGLQSRGADVTYLMAPDEGHGFVKPENVTKMWQLVEQHFAKHLGGRSST